MQQSIFMQALMIAVSLRSTSAGMLVISVGRVDQENLEYLCVDSSSTVNHLAERITASTRYVAELSGVAARSIRIRFQNRTLNHDATLSIAGVVSLSTVHFDVKTHVFDVKVLIRTDRSRPQLQAGQGPTLIRIEVPMGHRDLFDVISREVKSKINQNNSGQAKFLNVQHLPILWSIFESETESRQSLSRLRLGMSDRCELSIIPRLDVKCAPVKLNNQSVSNPFYVLSPKTGLFHAQLVENQALLAHPVAGLEDAEIMRVSPVISIGNSHMTYSKTDFLELVRGPSLLFGQLDTFHDGILQHVSFLERFDPQPEFLQIVVRLPKNCNLIFRI